MDIEKIYKIDEAGNIDIERSLTLTNQVNYDVDISELALYVNETVNSLVNARAMDSSGDLDIHQKRQGSKIKMTVYPRIDTLSKLQKYKITWLYQFPNEVHKLGNVWLFYDIISGMDTTGFDTLISDKKDIKLQVVLPKLKKGFWESTFHESAPFCKELAKNDKSPAYTERIVLEWTNSLFSDSNCRVELIYGVRPNTRLVQFLTAVSTAIVTGIVSYLFSRL